MTETSKDASLQFGMFRLVTGEDIITIYSVIPEQGAFVWIHPLKLIMRRMTTGDVGIILVPWLPEEIILPANNMTCRILIRDVLTILPVRTAMQDFYHTVKSIIEERIKRNNERLDKNLYDMADMYISDTRPLIQDYVDQFEEMTDHEGITYH